MRTSRSKTVLGYPIIIKKKCTCTLFSTPSPTDKWTLAQLSVGKLLPCVTTGWSGSSDCGLFALARVLAAGEFPSTCLPLVNNNYSLRGRQYLLS